jgi:thiopeptide-type bacteriocin biosynthesis protein
VVLSTVSLTSKAQPHKPIDWHERAVCWQLWASSEAVQSWYRPAGQPRTVQHLETAPDTRTWSSWHLHVQTNGGQALDQILRDVVAPMATSLAVSEPDGQPASRPWFFIRYWQYGPHVRLRIADLDADQASSVTSALDTRMDSCLKNLDDAQRMDQNDYAQIVSGIAHTGEGGRSMAVGTLAPAGVQAQEYEPEIDRYGGAAQLELSENLFHSSSIAALRACLRRPSYAHHLGDGLEAMAATLSAWPDDRELVLRRTRDGWSDFIRNAGLGNAAAVEEFATKKAHSLSGIADQLTEISRGAPTRWSGWTGQLASACELWIIELGRARAAGIFASHLHMMQNRLGVAAGREAYLAATLLKLLDL